jgi:predicted kinase
MIILFCGLPGVGKTRLANELATLINNNNSLVLSTDKIRKELISQPTYSREEKELVYDVMLLLTRYLHNEAGMNCILDGTFNTEESRRKARKELLLSSLSSTRTGKRTTKRTVDEAETTTVTAAAVSERDGGGKIRRRRRRRRRVGEEDGGSGSDVIINLPKHIYIVECICPEEIVISRLKSRKRGFSDADVDVYRKMKRLYEPVREEEEDREEEDGKKKWSHIVIDTSQDPKVNAEEIRAWIFGKNGK